MTQLIGRKVYSCGADPALYVVDNAAK
jgi:hypothetical protein